MSCRSDLTGSRVSFAFTATPLVQIKTGYSARWNGLNLSVEGVSGEWTLHVHDSANVRSLYSGQRSSATAAQIAAADFALLFTGAAARQRPELLARELAWAKSW